MTMTTQNLSPERHLKGELKWGLQIVKINSMSWFLHECKKRKENQDKEIGWGRMAGIFCEGVSSTAGDGVFCGMGKYGSQKDRGWRNILYGFLEKLRFLVFHSRVGYVDKFNMKKKEKKLLAIDSVTIWKPKSQKMISFFFSLSSFR